MIKSLKKVLPHFLTNTNKFNIKGSFEQGKNCSISDCKINIAKNAKLILGDNVCLKNFSISIEEGEMHVGNNSILEKGNNSLTPSIYINNGSLKIGNHSLIRADICVRFNGNCSIGNYTGIMEQTEIRCDEFVAIGDFNMISYECMIYDTNTHCAYSPSKRRKITQDDFPLIGLEREKPITKPINIADDCWLGKRAVVLKGVEIGLGATIGTCAVVTKSVPSNHIAFGNPAQIVAK